MKLTVKFRFPKTEKETMTAWIEPQHVADRKKLKDMTGREFIKVEADSEKSLSSKVTETMYKLMMIFERNTEKVFVVEHDLKRTT